MIHCVDYQCLEECCVVMFGYVFGTMHLACRVHRYMVCKNILSPRFMDLIYHILKYTSRSDFCDHA